MFAVMIEIKSDKGQMSSSIRRSSPNDPISLADVGSESLLVHPDSRSVRAGSRFAGSGFAGGGFAGFWGRLPGQFRSVTRNHHWVSGMAASLLLVLGLSGFWYMNSRGFVVTSSQAMVDLR